MKAIDDKKETADLQQSLFVDRCFFVSDAMLNFWRKCSTPVDHLMPGKPAPVVSGNLENKIYYLVVKLTDVLEGLSLQ